MLILIRRIMRDMPNATGDEIQEELELYVKYGRIALLETSKQVLPSADCVADGTDARKERNIRNEKQENSMCNVLDYINGNHGMWKCRSRKKYYKFRNKY